MAKRWSSQEIALAKIEKSLVPRKSFGMQLIPDVLQQRKYGRKG
jgi:hypothetical protein